MIETLATIGKALIGEGPFKGEELLERLVENPNATGNCPKVIQIIFSQSDDGENPVFSFQRLDHVDYDDHNRVRYLYRFGSASGSDHSPSCKMTEPARSYPRRFIGSIKSSANNGDLPESQRLWFKALLKAAQNAADEIVSGLEELNDGLDSNEGALLTLIIERNGKRLLPHDLEHLRDTFVRSVIESFVSRQAILARRRIALESAVSARIAALISAPVRRFPVQSQPALEPRHSTVSRHVGALPSNYDARAAALQAPRRGRR